MRILLVNRHYGGDQVPTGRMLRDLAEVLTGEGHEVDVVATKSSYAGVPDQDATLNVRRLIHPWGAGERARVVSWFAFLTQATLLTPLMEWDRCVLLTVPPFLCI